MRHASLGKLIGVLLLALALRAGLTIDDMETPPAPRPAIASPRRAAAPTAAEHGERSQTSPCGLRPNGAWRGEDFAWQWSGPAITWRLALFDEQLVLLARSEPLLELHGVELHARAPASWTEHLGRGERRYWMVEATLDGRRVASAPMPFTVVR